ncbi:MAG: hypothetical protein II664_07705 [Oscillospiraceae bacterium]|nr:hypothetical protein [Oscillospiraceae bacterium]
MFFRKKKDYYSESMKILTEKGYCEEYTEKLLSEIAEAKSPSDIAEGKSRYANSLLFMGELKRAANAYEDVETEKVPKVSAQAFLANRILCLFLLNRFAAADEIYVQYNKIVLGEPNVFLRRSLGIHQFIAGNFDAAVTVFIKIINDYSDERKTLMTDICIVRSFLKLDMIADAQKASEDFSAYDGKNELTELCRKLRKKIFDKSNSADKVKMVTNKKKK